MNDYDPDYVHVPVYFLLGVKTIVVNDEGKILILQRSDKTSRAHGWDFPGGAVDKNESPLDAALREVKEETGLDITNMQILTANLYSWDKHKNDAVIIGYSARCTGADVLLSWEHEAYKWATLDELHEIELPDQHVAILDAYKQ